MTSTGMTEIEAFSICIELAHNAATPYSGLKILMMIGYADEPRADWLIVHRCGLQTVFTALY